MKTANLANLRARIWTMVLAMGDERVSLGLLKISLQVFWL
jgi:hypothetical protein